jgi:hypothetical protein
MGRDLGLWCGLGDFSGESLPEPTLPSCQEEHHRCLLLLDLVSSDPQGFRGQSIVCGKQEELR